MLTKTIVVSWCYLLSLAVAQPFQGFLGDPSYFEQFWNNHHSASLRSYQRPSRKSNFGDNLFGFHDYGFHNPYTSYDTNVATNHRQPQHLGYHSHPAPPHYPAPTHPPPGHYPPYYHRPTPQPPSFPKPPFHQWPPHHPHYPHPTPPGHNYNYRPPQNQGSANGADCNQPTPVQPTNINQVSSTSTAVTNTNTFQPSPSKQQQTAQINTIVSGIFPGSIQTVTTTSTGTAISNANDGLISGTIGQSNRPLFNIPPSQQTDQKNVNIGSQQRPTSSLSTVQPTSVNHLVSGVFPSLVQGGNSGNANIVPATNDKNVDDLVAGVFPGLNQPQTNNPTQSTQVTSVNDLVSGVFQQGTKEQNNQPQSTETTPADVNNLVAGVFPGLGQPEKAPNSGVTISSNTNSLISGVFQGFQGSSQKGGPTRQPSSIPVFQPAFQPASNGGQTQPSISVSTSSSTTTLIQPSTTGSNGGSTTNGNADDEPAYDIDIRFGSDREEVNSTGDSTSQRNNTENS